VAGTVIAGTAQWAPAGLAVPLLASLLIPPVIILAIRIIRYQ